MKKLNALSEVIAHLSIVALVAIATLAMGYFMFFNWLARQEYLQLLRYMPAMLSFFGFVYAILRTVPVLENFWGLTRSRINTQHPWCVYIAIGLWLIFINSIIFAFGYQIGPGVSFNGIVENYYGRYTNDTPHYIEIAQRWYENSNDCHRFHIVFFPLYPILIRLVAFISPGYIFAAWFISNVFAFASGVLFYKLAGLVTDESEARLAVKYLFIFPSAFFFFVPLTESLFLFLSVAVIYYTLKEKYVHVFIFGLLVSLTRSAGLLLFVPVACEVIRQVILAYRKMELAAAKDSAQPTPISIPRWLIGHHKFKLLALSSFFIGLVIYLLINLAVYGNATQFIIFQREHWSQNLYFFWNTITTLNTNLTAFHSGWALSVGIPGIIAFWLTLGLIIYGARKLRVSFTLYIMAYFIFSFGVTWLMSGPRYASVLFPLALTTAKLSGKHKWLNIMITIAYLVMFVLYFDLFIQDRWIF